MRAGLTAIISTYLDYPRVPLAEMKEKGIYFLQQLIYNKLATSDLGDFPYKKWVVFLDYFER